MSHTPSTRSRAVMMTSLVPACYLITVKQQWPLDGGLTPSRAKHLTHMIRLSSWTLEHKLARLGVLGPLCLQELPHDISVWSKGLRLTHDVLYYWFADPDLAPLTGTHLGDVNLELVQDKRVHSCVI